jgi:hypothetical protein
LKARAWLYVALVVGAAMAGQPESALFSMIGLGIVLVSGAIIASLILIAILADVAGVEGGNNGP